MTRLPVLIRQNRVFELVVQGQSYAEICAALEVSPDTVARDMAEIDQQVRELAKERAGEVLAIALASYQKVLDLAWHEFHQEVQLRRDWFLGNLDYTHETVVTKTIATEDQTGAQGFDHESAPLEVKRTAKTMRPQLRTDRAQWLQLIVTTTTAMVELLGIKKLIVEHGTKDDQPISHVHMSLEQWRAQAAARLDAASGTYALLGDDAESDDAEGADGQQ